MDRNFSRSLSFVLKHEGGFVDHPSDPGGATNKGITIATYRRFIKSNGTVADLKAITPAQVATIYRKQYWDAVKGDDLPDGVDYAVFDFAVNSGPGRAVKHLQAAVGVAQDGLIGPATLFAARKAARRSTIATICGSRMDFLRGLSTWSTFGKGWSRRVTDVQRAALAMAGSTAPAPQPAEPAKGLSFWAGLIAAILRIFSKG